MIQTIPKTMSAITIQKSGGPEVLNLTSITVPQIKEDEVLIKVKAAGINRPDIAQRQGIYPPPPGANPHLGLEVAGEIVQVPANCPFDIGDNVCALTNGGGYAQYCAVPFTQCLPWPRGFNASQAAALPETFFTVWTNLFEIGHLKKNESILIHGGSGGIGTTAIQVARAFGATIYTTVSSAEKGKLCQKLGAAEWINYKQDNFAEKIMEITQQKGVDLILDIMGASYFHTNIKLLKEDGRLLIISFLGGVKVQEVNLATIVKRRLTITGSTLRPRTTEFKEKIAQALYKNIWPLLEKNIIKPHIHKILPFNQVSQAHQLMESSQHSGKIILDLTHL